MLSAPAFVPALGPGTASAQGLDPPLADALGHRWQSLVWGCTCSLSTKEATRAEMKPTLRFHISPPPN